MAYDSARDRVVKFAGFGLPINLETWEFDGTDWSLRATAGPPIRQDVHLVYDAARQRVVSFGGLGPVDYVNETWEWDGTVWTQKFPAHAPPARQLTSMAYDAGRQRVVLFGGRLPNDVYLNDIWEYDGTDWTPRVIPQPATEPIIGSIVYDTLRHVIVLAGASFNLPFQTWAYDGNGWSPVPEPPNVVCPPPSGAFSMVYMQASDQILMTLPSPGLSGLGATSYVLGAMHLPVIFLQPLDQVVPIGGEIDLSIGATCVPGSTYRWRLNGNPLFDFQSGQSAITGAATTSMRIYGPTVTPTRSGLYDCVVTSPCGNVTSATADVNVTCEPQAVDFAIDPSPVTFTINIGGASFTISLQLLGVVRVLLDPSCTGDPNPRTHGSIVLMDLHTEPPVVTVPDFFGGTATLNNARLLIGPGYGDPGTAGPVRHDRPTEFSYTQEVIEPDLLGSFGYHIGTLIGSTSLSTLAFQPLGWTFSITPRGVHGLTLPFTAEWIIDNGQGGENPRFTLQTVAHGHAITRCGRADIASLGGLAIPDGQLTADDIIVFLDAYFRNIFVVADVASLGGIAGPDGRLTADDVIVFLAAFFAGCT
ncbi:MAG: GC-type dockerin domain-anchored protein [Phycisphaerales bacterium]